MNIEIEKQIEKAQKIKFTILTGLGGQLSKDIEKLVKEERKRYKIKKKM